MSTIATAARPQVRVWDLPLRLFHWLLAASFATAWLTRDDRLLDLHVFAGYLFAGLLLFRLLWGFAGSRHSRFRDFAYGPRSVLGYVADLLRGRAAAFTGHNPAGSWAIYGLLALGLGIAVTGLLTFGGEERHGPLAGLIGFAAGAQAHQLHELLAWSMLALVAVHLIGVVVESWLHRENLAAAMVHGHKRSALAPVAAHGALAGLLLLAVAGGAFFWFEGYLDQTPDRPYVPFTGPTLPDNATWREECGGCHLAFAPSLLPTRSWERLLDEQESHFGEDLMLEPETVEELRAFLTANAAETAPTEAAWKIDRSIAAGEQPLRISATPYWKAKHAEIPEAVFTLPPVNSPANCAACHLDADAGTFEDGAMRMPAEPQQP